MTTLTKSERIELFEQWANKQPSEIMAQADQLENESWLISSGGKPDDANRIAETAYFLIEIAQFNRPILLDIQQSIKDNARKPGLDMLFEALRQEHRYGLMDSDILEALSNWRKTSGDEPIPHEWYSGQSFFAHTGIK